MRKSLLNPPQPARSQQPAPAWGQPSRCRAGQRGGGTASWREQIGGCHGAWTYGHMVSCCRDVRCNTEVQSDNILQPWRYGTLLWISCTLHGGLTGSVEALVLHSTPTAPAKETYDNRTCGPRSWMSSCVSNARFVGKARDHCRCGVSARCLAYLFTTRRNVPGAKEWPAEAYPRLQKSPIPDYKDSGKDYQHKLPSSIHNSTFCTDTLVATWAVF